MTMRHSRRDVLKGSLAVAGLSVFGLPEWALPALAQGEEVLPFADFPDTFSPTPRPDVRLLDVRTITGPITPADQFFTTQHYGHPVVDPSSFRLRVSGMVDRELSLSLDDLRAMGGTEIVAGFECSGNRRPLQGLSGNGRWTGVPLRAVLDRAGLKAEAREIVFFGADRGKEEVEFRTQKYEVEQQYGRSMTRDQVMGTETLLAYAMNGAPLTRHQGFPLRVLVPGWYGAPNVKWLAEIHVQDVAYLGKYQARWYRTLRGEVINGELKWVEKPITHQQLKSFIARVTKRGDAVRVVGVVLNDGTAIRSVEVKVDDGPWQQATLDPSTTEKYSWKLFSYDWTGATPGEHTIVSRVTDVNGQVQPTLEELANKKTFLEDNSQHPRTVRI
jgi:DMSO/TMAO reductase YedYZ molybdopterin-dependent catalytic subunit